MLEVKNIRHSFGDFTAVDGVSFNVQAGEIVSIIGPNGAGKTTILNILAGVLLPTSGSVTINGIDFFTFPEKAKKITSYIPEQPYLWGKLSGIEFLHFIRSVYGSSMTNDEIENNLSDFGIYGQRNHLIETYSHGIKQKLLFLTVPIINPNLILLDEPLVGLDPKAVIKVTSMLRQRASAGAAVLMSTHVLSFAEKLSERVLLIDNGKIILHGRLADILEKDKKTLEELFLRETA